MSGPTITIVTPSLNQGQFIEETLRSVLDQKLPGLEYIVIDGGSSAGTVDILRRYEGRLARWVSEPRSEERRVGKECRARVRSAGFNRDREIINRSICNSG